MDTHPGEPTLAQGPLESIRDELLSDPGDADRVQEAAEILREIARSASDAARNDLSQLAALLANLLSIASSLDPESAAEESAELVGFVREELPVLQEGLDDGEPAVDGIRNLIQEAHRRWGDCLELVDELTDSTATIWDTPSLSAETVEEDVPVPEPGQIGAILNSLAALPVDPDPPPETLTSFPDSPADAASTPPLEGMLGDGTGPLDDQLVLDPEIREAYLDDAQRCLAVIESSLLAFESDSANRQPLRQVCRELHTLKGASASVGMSRLAQFLHQVEDDLQRTCEQPDGVEIEPILQCVDVVRRQMQSCGGESSDPSSSVGSGGGRSDRLPDAFVEAPQSAQDSVRVKAAQLDRLMDMLAELVMLRNRRESHVEQLKEIQGELTLCVSRVRAFDDRLIPGLAATPHPEARGAKVGSTRRRVSSLTEIANDLLGLGRSLRELYEPVADENLAISRFIRHFRQELMQLRRVPVGGLFRRLQRAARDAARVEGKKAQLLLIGEEVGLERSIQEQLYEPLLHMVRNAVSHGIESESSRVAAGKDPVGMVSLEAQGGSNLLVVTVRDDGRGLDYDALRRRGTEMGLIPVDRPASRSELARLIFHPGFSTRRDTTAVSGRGVGMDVVASTLERMHSWVEVDSTPGAGTSIRLLIPLHSVIEHVMVFRSGGQDFGMPTQFVQTAGPWQDDGSVEFPVLPFTDLCPGLRANGTATPQLIVLAHGWRPGEARSSAGEPSGFCQNSDRETRLGLLVDEIVGPEEVVVRPLPGLLKNQRLFSGVTLSGTGDIMLLFDSQRLLERGISLTRSVPVSRAESDISDSSTDLSESPGRVLVVDDSRSSRRALIQFFTPRGWSVEEAVDGLQALKMIRSNVFDLIVTDLEMPQLGGMELLRELKSQPTTQALPVVIVSSRDEELFREEAARLGAIAYLVKPFNEHNLGEVLPRTSIDI